MKKFSVLCIAGLIALAASSAQADVSGLTLKFGGGCLESNTTGSCTLKVYASGTDLGAEGVQVRTAATQKGPFKTISKTVHSLSSSGYATIRVKNNAGGCYEVVTGPNGNDKPDTTSNKKCE